MVIENYNHLSCLYRQVADEFFKESLRVDRTGAVSDRVNKSEVGFTFGKIHVTANCAVNGLILATLGLVREHYAFPVREGALSQVAPHTQRSLVKKYHVLFLAEFVAVNDPLFLQCFQAVGLIKFCGRGQVHSYESYIAHFVVLKNIGRTTLKAVPSLGVF